MELKLNEHKVSMLSIGKMHFTFVNPGPHPVDIELLDEPQLNQLLYNIRKGSLVTKDSLERLLELTKELPAASKEFKTPNEDPLEIAGDVLEPQGRLEQDTQILKKILKGNVETVKKEASELNTARTRKLLDIELHSKKRAGVIKYLEQRVFQFQQEVNNKIGTTPVQHTPMTQKELVKGITDVNWDNIGDVVESNIEQITLNPYPED